MKLSKSNNHKKITEEEILLRKLRLIRCSGIYGAKVPNNIENIIRKEYGKYDTEKKK